MDIRMSNIATPMPPIRARFTSKLGIPLSGCKVYTYEPNSNIPKTTWINIDKTVENTNPILLDAAGEADIFLDGLYQIVVKDRFGFVVYDVEKTGIVLELDASFVVDGNINQHERNSGIKSITQLRLTKPSKKGDRVFLASVNEDQNEGGGEFIATQKAGLVDDGGLVIASPDPLLFWVRINYETATPEMFGAKTGVDVSNITINDIAIQSWLNKRTNLTTKGGVYLYSKPMIAPNSVQIKGSGFRNTEFRKMSNDRIDFTYDIPDGSGSITKNIDALLIIKASATTKYVDSVKIEDVTFSKYYDLDNGSKENPTYGLFAPYLSESTIQNTSFLDVFYPVYAINVWMVNLFRVLGAGYGGWVLGGLSGDTLRGGTSITSLSCWSQRTRGENYAWNLYGLSSSNFLSSSSDSIGLDNSPADGVWDIEKCNLVVTHPACEVVHAKRYMRFYDSTVSIIGGSTHEFHNKYGGYAKSLFALDGYSAVTVTGIKFVCLYGTGDSVNITPLSKVSEYSSFEISNSTLYPRPTGINTSLEYDIIVDGLSSAKINGVGGSAEYSTVGDFMFPNSHSEHKTNSNTQITGAAKGYWGAVNTNAAKWDTNIFRLGELRLWYNQTNESLMIKPFSDPTSDTDGNPLIGSAQLKRGTTADRPSVGFSFTGMYYFDTTINKPIWFNGVNWTDSDGAVV